MSSVLINAGDKAEGFQKTITAASTYQTVWLNDMKQPAKLVDLGICNYHSSAVTISVVIYRLATATAYKRYDGYSLASKATLEPNFAAYLYEDDEIRVSASVANVVDVTGMVVQAF